MIDTTELRTSAATLNEQALAAEARNDSRAYWAICAAYWAVRGAIDKLEATR